MVLVYGVHSHHYSQLFKKILLTTFLMLFIVIVSILLFEKIEPSNPDNNPKIIECRIKNKQKIIFNETEKQQELRFNDLKKCLNSSWLFPMLRKFHCDIYFKTGGKMEDWCYGYNIP